MSFVQQVMSGPTRRMVDTVVKNNPMLSAEEEIACHQAWMKRGDQAARDRLVLSYMPLAMKMVSALKGYNMMPDDLLGMATAGLLVAVEKFDPSRGARFGTCAKPWVKEQMLVYIMQNRSILKGPQTSTAKILFFNMARFRAKLGVEGPLNGEQAQQIADMIYAENPKTANLSAQGVMDYDNYATARVMSADAERSEDGEGLSLLSTLPDETIENPDLVDEDDITAMRKKFLYDAIGQLKEERDRSVFIARHIRNPSLSLEEVGQLYGVSRERIRQIESRAVGKVKAAIENMVQEYESRRQVNGLVNVMIS